MAGGEPSTKPRHPWPRCAPRSTALPPAPRVPQHIRVSPPGCQPWLPSTSDVSLQPPPNPPQPPSPSLHAHQRPLYEKAPIKSQPYVARNLPNPRFNYCLPRNPPLPAQPKQTSPSERGPRFPIKSVLTFLLSLNPPRRGMSWPRCGRTGPPVPAGRAGGTHKVPRPGPFPGDVRGSPRQSLISPPRSGEGLKGRVN